MANTDRIFTKVTFEGKQSVEDIQRQFRQQLSEQQILKATSKAINVTAYRVQKFIQKEIKSQYTVNNKYLNRNSKISKRAQSAASGLYAHISFSYQTVPLIGFTHASRQTKSGARRRVTVKIKKGKGNTTNWQHAFIAKMSGISNKGEHYEHEGVFAAGRYTKGGFVSEKNITKAQKNHPRSQGGKLQISELRGPSVFTMSTNSVTQERTSKYVEDQLPKRVEAFIKQQVKKITK